MEIQIKNDYLEIVQDCIVQADSCGVDSQGMKEVEASIKKQELLVPVVGGFSAGKSSLLNSLLGNSLLPTGIAPETALAAELRYDASERIEAIKNDDSVQTFSLDDFAEIGKKSGEFKYLKVYISNKNIKSIEPLILVDMPGFESPIEAHDKAINVYLDRGSYFVVLVSAQDGTLTRSAVSKLKNVIDCDRDFSVIVSKANLVTEQNAEAVCQKISEQIDIEFGIEKTAVPVGKDGADALKKIVESVNPDLLFKKIVQLPLKNELYMLESSANVKLSALKRSESENNDAVEQLKKALEKLKRTRDNLIGETSSQGALKEKVDTVISKVGSALSNNVESIIVAAQKSSDCASEEISDIVKSSLISSMKDVTDGMASEITGKINIELHDIERTFNSYANSESGISDVTLGKFSTVIKENISNGMTSLNAMVEERRKRADTTKVYKTVTTGLAILTNVIPPIAEIAIMYLPEIVSFFTEGIRRRKEEEARQKALEQAEQAKEKLRSQILAEVIPNVKRDLRPKVEKMVGEQAQAMVEQIAEQYENLLNQKQQEIDKAEEERKQHLSELNEKIGALEKVLLVIRDARNKVCA